MNIDLSFFNDWFDFQVTWIVRTSSIFSSNWIVTGVNEKSCPQAKNLIQRCNAVCWFTLHSPNLIKINFAFSLKKQVLFDQCHFTEVFYSSPSGFLTIDEFSGTSCFFRILVRPTGYNTRCARNLIGVYLTLCLNRAKLRKTLLLCNSNKLFNVNMHWNRWQISINHKITGRLKIQLISSVENVT